MDTKKHVLTVTDPSGFESPDGRNIIKGKIVKIISDACVVFKAGHLLEFGPISGNVLVLSTIENASNLRNLNAQVPVNGALLKCEFDEALDERDLQQNCVPVLLGAVTEDKSPAN